MVDVGVGDITHRAAIAGSRRSPHRLTGRWNVNVARSAEPPWVRLASSSDRSSVRSGKVSASARAGTDWRWRGMRLSLSCPAEHGRDSLPFPEALATTERTNAHRSTSTDPGLLESARPPPGTPNSH